MRNLIRALAVAVIPFFGVVGCSEGAGANSASTDGSERTKKGSIDQKPSSGGQAALEGLTSGVSPDGMGSLPDAGFENAPKSTNAPKAGIPEEMQDKVVEFDGELRVFIGVEDERVEFNAELLGGQSRPLEYLIVTYAGKTHEALLRIDCSAYDLKQAMELLLFKEGEKKLSHRGDSSMPDGELIDIHVVWRDPKGSVKVNRIEDWVSNRMTRKDMVRGPWVFTGSLERVDEQLGRTVFLADEVGNVAAIWRDPHCVIDNPRDSATDDMAYIVKADPTIMPPAFSTVRVVVRRHTFVASGAPDGGVKDKAGGESSGS